MTWERAVFTGFLFFGAVTLWTLGELGTIGGKGWPYWIMWAGSGVLGFWGAVSLCKILDLP